MCMFKSSTLRSQAADIVASPDLTRFCEMEYWVEYLKRSLLIHFSTQSQPHSQSFFRSFYCSWRAPVCMASMRKRELTSPIAIHRHHKTRQKLWTWWASVSREPRTSALAKTWNSFQFNGYLYSKRIRVASRSSSSLYRRSSKNISKQKRLRDLLQRKKKKKKERSKFEFIVKVFSVEFSNHNLCARGKVQRALRQCLSKWANAV